MPSDFQEKEDRKEILAVTPQKLSRCYPMTTLLCTSQVPHSSVYFAPQWHVVLVLSHKTVPTRSTGELRPPSAQNTYGDSIRVVLVSEGADRRSHRLLFSTKVGYIRVHGVSDKWSSVVGLKCFPVFVYEPFTTVQFCSELIAP